MTPENNATVLETTDRIRFYNPESLSTGESYWSLSLSLASLRTRRLWRSADLTDLFKLFRWCGQNGASAVIVEPLNEIRTVAGANAAAVGRGFIHPIYVDVEAVPDLVRDEDTQRLLLSPNFADRIAKCWDVDEAYWDELLSLKLSILERLYRRFREESLHRNTERAQAFRRFQITGGDALEKYSLFEALKEKVAPDWRTWPTALRAPGSPECAKFARDNLERLEFFQYVQWLADWQLETIGKFCLNRHFPLGLCLSLGSQVLPESFDAWWHQDIFADRGLAAGSDDALGSALEAIKSPLSLSMRHAGAVRIEPGEPVIRLIESPNEAYKKGDRFGGRGSVQSSISDTLSALSAESQRKKCAIISRDIKSSNAPIDAGSIIDECALCPTFDTTNPSSDPSSIADSTSWEARSLGILSSAELGMIGHWAGRDLSAMPDAATKEAHVEARVLQRMSLLKYLKQKGLLPEGMSIDPSSVPQLNARLLQSLYGMLSRASSQMVAVNLSEFMGSASSSGTAMTGTSGPADPPGATSVIFDDVLSSDVFAQVVRGMNAARPAFFKEAERLAKTGAKPGSPALPHATYRFQFNAAFTFEHGKQLIPYLAKLGVSHCYASPLLQARPGSTHGYDIINHKAINPEIGTWQQFEELVDELKRHKMGLILDIVPNHMGVGKDNPWWLDVLENGPASVYAEYFDIDWQPVKKELFGKVLLPILGESYGDVLTKGQLRLSFSPETGRLKLNYWDHEMPLNPVSYPSILGIRLDLLKERLGTNHFDVNEYISILAALSHIPGHTEPQGYSERLREKEVQLKRLSALCQRNPLITEFIMQNIDGFVVRDGDRAAVDRVHALLESQAYRLAYWRVASDEINYRRFFDVNDLAAVRTEDPRVFAEMHELVFELIEKGMVQGLRIDHVDGLFDPATYCQHLQKGAADKLGVDFDESQVTESNIAYDKLPIYILIEKILAPFEHLESNLAVHGTTGYDFLNELNELFVCCVNESAMSEIYQEFIEEELDYEDLKYKCKKLILDTVLASELNVLAHRLSQIAESNWFSRDLTLISIRTAIRLVVSNFPVYRTYAAPGRVDKNVRQFLDWAIVLAKRQSTLPNNYVFDFMRQVLTMETIENSSDDVSGANAESLREAIAQFAMKFQQFTGPVLAKSTEDTLFYRYHRLVSLNEVGGEPKRFGSSKGAFHHKNALRQQKRPYEMLTTSTHDTKRSEDVRARISVLSEIPDVWREKLNSWGRFNRSKKILVDDEYAPDLNDEYLVYQTMLGACPLEIFQSGAGETGSSTLESFRKRMCQYIVKAMREAKKHTSWINQNLAYEEAVCTFIEKLLTPAQTNPFLEDFLQFMTALAPLGLINSLSQTLLKLSCPGVPDVYQGNELWDFSLVDPDNRRPVDFQLREKFLHELEQAQASPSLEERHALIADLMGNPLDGRLKLLITAGVLALRKENPELMTAGRYIPLEIEGPASENVFAFAREHEGRWAIAVAPLMVAELMNKNVLTLFYSIDAMQEILSEQIWSESALLLPPELEKENIQLQDIFSLNKHDAGNPIPLASIFSRLPVAVLYA